MMFMLMLAVICVPILLLAGLNTDGPPGNDEVGSGEINDRPGTHNPYGWNRTITVNYLTGDGWDIEAFVYIPKQYPRGTIILAHGWNEHKARWNLSSFAPQLRDEGWTVLTYDLRGHGRSTTKNGETRTVPELTTNDIDNLDRDVDAGYKFLKDHDLLVEPVGIGGASTGANLALIELQKDRYDFFFGLSLTRDLNDVLTEDAAALAPAHVDTYFVACEEDSPSYEYTYDAFNASSDPAPQRRFFEGDRHGTNIIGNLGYAETIREWINKQ